MLALSIRQPYAVLIPSSTQGRLWGGVKTVEYRSFATRKIGERFFIYASLWRPAGRPGDRAAEAQKIWSDDLAVPGRTPGTAPPQRMLELAGLLIQGKLPRGLIVGTAVIERCDEVRDQKSEIRLTSDPRPLTSVYQWHRRTWSGWSRPESPAGARSRRGSGRSE